jgi:hypothetical protein
MVLGLLKSLGAYLKTEYLWTELVSEMQIELISGISKYRLPFDFQRFVADTAFNWSKSERIDQRSTSEWQKDDSLQNTNYRSTYKVEGVGINQFFIRPTPTTNGDLLVKNYLSRIWLRPQRWTLGKNYAIGDFVWWDLQTYVAKTYLSSSDAKAGGVSSLFPFTDLYQTEHLRESIESGKAPVHTSGTASDGGIVWQYVEYSHGDVIADSDTPLLDDYMVQLGLEYFILKTNGFDWSKSWETFQQYVARITADLSGAETIYIDRPSDDYFNIPLKDWVFT